MPAITVRLKCSRKAAQTASPAEDAALAPPVINTVPDSKYGDATRLVQGIPGIERAANGRLWALWYAGGPDEPGEGPGNYVVLVTSGDYGKAWSCCLYTTPTISTAMDRTTA